MPQAPPTRRRWFQFSSGTMFLLVTAFAVWLGWELSYVRERQAMLKDIVNRGGTLFPVGLTKDTPTKISPMRHWLGDVEVPFVGIPQSFSDAERKQVEVVFPEASIAIQIGDGQWTFNVFK